MSHLEAVSETVEYYKYNRSLLCPNCTVVINGTCHRYQYDRNEPIFQAVKSCMDANANIDWVDLAQKDLITVVHQSGACQQISADVIKSILDLLAAENSLRSALGVFE